MRLADMHRIHPDQISDHCANCGHEVGIYPSGQRIMRKAKEDIQILCQVCMQPGNNNWPALAPGAELEPFESIRKPR